MILLSERRLQRLADLINTAWPVTPEKLVELIRQVEAQPAGDFICPKCGLGTEPSNDHDACQPGPAR